MRERGQPVLPDHSSAAFRAMPGLAANLIFDQASLCSIGDQIVAVLQHFVARNGKRHVNGDTLRQFRQVSESSVNQKPLGPVGSEAESRITQHAGPHKDASA